jgi:PiT family inorganic phosphate transporter
VLTLLLLVIVTALVFEFINGFHDTANSIATVVATKVLTPMQAVALAADHEPGRRLLGTRSPRPLPRAWWIPTWWSVTRRC